MAKGGWTIGERSIRVNNTLTLECEAYAIPSASLSWYKDGQASHEFFHLLMVS